MLGFRGAAVPRRTTLQSSDQIVVQITHVQVPSHRALHEIIDLNDLTSPPFWSRIRVGLTQRLSGELSPVLVLIGYFVITLFICFAWPRPFVVGGVIMAVAAVLESLQAHVARRACGQRRMRLAPRCSALLVAR